MIEVFSLKNAHQFGDALASQARLRYRVFVEQRSLAHTFYDGMEYDEFDTPAAMYLVWRDADLIVRGLMRLVPTNVPYMLAQYWPHLAERRPLPRQADVWETSRVCVDRTYAPHLRKLVMPALMSGLQEFCRYNGVQAVVGVTRKHFLDHYLDSVEWLCESTEIEGEPEAAFWLPVEHMRPQQHCAKFSIPDRVLSFDPLNRRIAA